MKFAFALIPDRSVFLPGVGGSRVQQTSAVPRIVDHARPERA